MNLKNIQGKLKKVFSTHQDNDNCPAVTQSSAVDFDAIDAFIQTSIYHTKSIAETDTMSLKKANEMLWFILSQANRIKNKNCISVSQFLKMLDNYFNLTLGSQNQSIKMRFSHTQKQSPYFMASYTASVFAGITDRMLRCLKNSNLCFFVLLQEEDKFTLLAEKNNFDHTLQTREIRFYEDMQSKCANIISPNLNINYTVENNLLKVIVSETNTWQNDNDLSDLEINSKLVKYDYGNL